MNKKQKTEVQRLVKTTSLASKSSKKTVASIDQDVEKMAMVMQLVCW